LDETPLSDCRTGLGIVRGGIRLVAILSRVGGRLISPCTFGKYTRRFVLVGTLGKYTCRVILIIRTRGGYDRPVVLVCILARQRRRIILLCTLHDCIRNPILLRVLGQVSHRFVVLCGLSHHCGKAIGHRTLFTLSGTRVCFCTSGERSGSLVPIRALDKWCSRPVLASPLADYHGHLGEPKKMVASGGLLGLFHVRLGVPGLLACCTRLVSDMSGQFRQFQLHRTPGGPIWPVGD
jgi:hypothetical protein